MKSYPTGMNEWKNICQPMVTANVIYHCIIDTKERKRKSPQQETKNPIFHNFLLFLSIFSLVNQTMANLDAGQVRRIFSEALDVWSRGSLLTFQEVYGSDADIQVLFAR